MNRSGETDSEFRIPAKKILKWALLVSATIVCVHLLLQFLNLNVYHQQNGQIYELSNRFDLDDEASVPTWYGQSLLLAFAVSSWLASILQKNKKSRRLWRLLATLGLLFSIDEVAGLHERLLQTIHVLLFQDNSPTNSANAWLVLAPFLLILALWLAWSMWKHLPRHTFWLFALAGGVFVSGAVAVDLITNSAPRETFLNQGILVAIEEAMELVGTSLALYVVADYLQLNFTDRIHRTIKSLRI